MVCFSNKRERDRITDLCDGCWVGYKWIDGKFEYSFILPWVIRKASIYTCDQVNGRPLVPSLAKHAPTMLFPEPVENRTSGLDLVHERRVHLITSLLVTENTSYLGEYVKNQNKVFHRIK